LVRAHFPLTRGHHRAPESAPPIYRKTAAFGHFGRTEDTFSWEKTDKAAALREEAKPGGRQQLEVRLG
jgi:S-adenosylmethionine synthetase